MYFFASRLNQNTPIAMIRNNKIPQELIVTRDIFQLKMVVQLNFDKSIFISSAY